MQYITMNFICHQFGMFSLSNGQLRISFLECSYIFTSEQFENGRDIFKLWSKWRRRYLYDLLSLTFPLFAVKVPSFNQEGIFKKVTESLDLRHKIFKRTGMKLCCMLQLRIQYSGAILREWVLLTFFLLFDDILVAYHHWQHIK